MAEATRPMIGDPKHLAFEIAWTPEPADARGLGWGDFVVWFAGSPLWTSAAQGQPVAWTWIDLVEHLARAWGHLLYEEVYPFGLTAADPEALRTHAKLASVPGKTATEVEDAVHAFQHRHDLAAGLKGIDLPPIWLVREGTLMRIRAEKRDLWRPCDEVLATLTALVEAVRARTVTPAARAKAAFERWDAREPHRELVLWLQTGLSTEDLRRWAPQNVKDPLAWWGTTTPSAQRTSSGRARRASGRQLSYLDMIRADDTPLRAVARLSQSLAESTRIAVVRAISCVSSSPTPELDELAKAAVPVIDAFVDQVPHQQGYRLALWLRSKLAIAEDGQVNPETLLRRWGVIVQNLDRLEPSLDAVACWGNRGPAVLINPGGQHAVSRAGRAATLAHEIGHLIMDSQRSLPLAEVFGGATPLHLEQRARAFAAELLLPREVAGLQVMRASSLEKAAATLRSSYGVSTEVVGWQIRNGPGWERLDASDRKVVAGWLRRWARAPRRPTELRSPTSKIAARQTQDTRTTVTPARAPARSRRSLPQRSPR